MRILFAALQYDYGVRERGFGFEHYNFYEPLLALGHDVRFLDLGEGARPGVAGTADDALHRAVEQQPPDLVFSVLFGDELTPGAIAAVTTSGVPTLNWFADDHWRFEDFTRRYAPSFSWVTTTDRAALPRYAAIGCTDVVKTQWAAAQHRYRPSGRPLQHEATFVGQVYGERAEIVAAVRRAGVPVQTWGTGWDVRRWHRLAAREPLGRLGGARVLARAQATSRCSQEEMVAIFGESRVNLNLTEASQGGESQIKGRTFEVPACGGFLLTGAAEDLEHYYEPDREVAVFHDRAELVELARYYLDHEDERARVARAGYTRTIAEHTYELRFRAIFAAMGIDDEQGSRRGG